MHLLIFINHQRYYQHLHALIGASSAIQDASLVARSFSQFNMNSRAGIKISAQLGAHPVTTQNHAARVIRILIEPRSPRFSADRETGT